jgi:hypothetical protein
MSERKPRLTKLEVMSKKSLPELLEFLMTKSPGITTDAMYKKAQEWSKDITAHEFDLCLGELRDAKSYRVTGKQWYPSKKAS